MENDLDMALCEMTKQRDDLLEALKYVAQGNPNSNASFERYSVRFAKEAIEKSEGLHK